MKLNPTNTSIIKRLLVGRSSRPLLSILSRVEPADLAGLFASLNERESRLLVDALMTIDKASETLLEIPEPQLGRLLPSLESDVRFSLMVYADEEDTAYFLRVLDEDERESILSRMETPKRSRIRQFLEYPKDSAGRMMQTQVFSLPSHFTAAEGLEFLRTKAQEQSIYYIYCVNEDQQLIGVISLRALATAPSNTPLTDLLKRDLVTARPETPADEVARTVAHYDFVAIPVVDESRRLLGIITVDDVVDIIQEQATANIYAQAGLQESDRIYSAASSSIKNRLPWMFLNLIMAAIASAVISLFEETMSQLIILASLNNIVAGVGGNTAIQSLTVVTRGIATGDFTFITQSKAILKEVTVGVVLGSVTGLSAGVLVYFWKGSLLVAIVIYLAMQLNSLVASAAGAIVPLVLSRFNLDPAVGSGVLVTMITDIFGFFSFLGIATIGLHLVGVSL